MTSQRAFVFAVIGLFAFAQPVHRASNADHDKAYWQAIAADKYHVPVGASVGDLTNEIAERLASPDPEWRDTIAYNTLASWIYQQRLLDAAELRALTARLTTNLQVHVGSTDTDDVFRRSFSALVLSVIVARDNDAPVLESADIRPTLDAALGYLAAEQDVRGYVPVKGWAHSAAHTADLLKFLARNRFVTPADHARILTALTHKLTTTPAVFVFGEDERMARAVLSVVKRADFDADGFRAWIASSTPKFPPESILSVSSLQAFQNLKNLLSKLEVLMATDAQPMAGETAALDLVRAALKSAY